MLNWFVSRKIFLLRTLIFALGALLFLSGRQHGLFVFKFELALGLRVYHLLWALLMFEMIIALQPGLNHFIGRGKIFKKNYIYRPHKLQELKIYTKKNNQRAFLIALAWAAVIVAAGTLKLSCFNLVMLSVLFYFLDQLFVNLWCPIQRFILHNRCCATCRIYSWGFPIIVSPLIYIKSFWSYSLVAMGALLLLQWEFINYSYPERFFELSNAAITCRYCNERCSKPKR